MKKFLSDMNTQLMVLNKVDLLSLHWIKFK